jgi:integrase
MQMAIAIDLLTMCPLRIKNLANLKLNDTLSWSRPGRRGCLMVTIPAESVKNSQPIEFEVHKEIVPRIVRYLDTYRPQLFDDPGDWLFPGRNGGAKQSGALGKQIKDAIYKHSGLDVPAHSIRHVTAKLYLERQPAAFEVVRLVLGHSSSDTTIEHYTGLENKAAVRHFDETILEQRDEAALSKSRRGRRPPK